MSVNWETSKERVQMFITEYREQLAEKDKELERRDKTIAELQKDLQQTSQWLNVTRQISSMRGRQRNVMLSALERAQKLLNEWMAIPYRQSFILTHDIALELSTAVNDAIAKVKALPVSRQGETSDTSVASEQP